ncbi:MAG: hypothetical protein JNM93_08580 [Bacteriovoracaceae bacterium]|nr:hypothetical protein [Bacteriovoracaceae bacterium]
MLTTLLLWPLLSIAQVECLHKKTNIDTYSKSRLAVYEDQKNKNEFEKLYVVEFSSEELSGDGRVYVATNKWEGLSCHVKLIEEGILECEHWSKNKRDLEISANNGRLTVLKGGTKLKSIGRDEFFDKFQILSQGTAVVYQQPVGACKMIYAQEQSK